MEMPTPCPVCGEVVELNDMVGIESGRSPEGGGNLVCENCLCEDCGGLGSCCEDYCLGGECECCGQQCPVCKGNDFCQNCDGNGFKLNVVK